MRTIGWLAGAMLLASCGEASPGLASVSCPLCIADDSRPAGAVLSTLVDLGDVSLGDEVTRKITLLDADNGIALDINESLDDLTPFATDLACSSSCGQRHVASGGHLDIGFTFRPADPGPAEKVVRFASSAGPISVRLEGRGVVPDIECVPSKLDFGALVQGTSLTRSITCQNHGDTKTVLVVEPAVDDTQQFTVSDGRLEVGPLGSVDIPVTLSALLLSDDVTTSAQVFGSIRIDNGDGSTVLPVLTSGTVLRSALEIDPGPPVEASGYWLPYDFGFVTPGAVGRKVLTLRNLGSSPLTITTLSIDGSSDPEFLVESPEPPPFQIPGGGEVQIELTFAPPVGDVGARTGQLDVNSDDPAGQVRFFDLAGFGGGPALSCTWEGAPDVLDFGQAPAGTSSTREIVCTNVSEFNDPTTDADNLVVLEPFMRNDFSDYQVSIPGGPLRKGYDVGQSFTLEVQFRRSWVGQHDDQVVLKTNDPAHLEYDIPVTGKAD